MLNKEKYRDKIFEIAVNHDTCGVKKWRSAFMWRIKLL